MFYCKLMFKNDNSYGLCPSHYLSAPALSWGVVLTMTKVVLEFIPDHDIYIFFEKGTRGGVSNISIRYTKANNEYLKSYDPRKYQNIFIYLDANNLYGYAMSTFFPTSRFK